MAEQWKPGDVAMVRIDDRECIGLKDTHGWATSNRRGDRSHAVWTCDAQVTPLRRLLVVDPENRAQVERIAAAYWNQDNDASAWEKLIDRYRRDVSNHMQDAFRGLVAPPESEPEHVVTPEMVKAMFKQVALDRKQSAYWRDRNERFASLDHVESWLGSLADWIGGGDA